MITVELTAYEVSNVIWCLRQILQNSYVHRGANRTLNHLNSGDWVAMVESTLTNALPVDQYVPNKSSDVPLDPL